MNALNLHQIRTRLTASLIGTPRRARFLVAGLWAIVAALAAFGAHQYITAYEHLTGVDASTAAETPEAPVLPAIP